MLPPGSLSCSALCQAGGRSRRGGRGDRKIPPLGSLSLMGQTQSKTRRSPTHQRPAHDSLDSRKGVEMFWTGWSQTGKVCWGDTSEQEKTNGEEEDGRREGNI